MVHIARILQLNKVKGTHVKYQFNVLSFYNFYEFIFLVSFVFSPPTPLSVLPFIDTSLLRKSPDLSLCLSCLHYFLSVSNSLRISPLSLSGFKYKRLFYPIVLRLFSLLTCAVYGIPIFILTNHIAAVSNPLFINIDYIIEELILQKRLAHCFCF